MTTTLEHCIAIHEHAAVGDEAGVAALRAELALLRAQATAWRFLLAYDHPDPVPGATLGEYMDAAYAYAHDETGTDATAGGQR